MDEQLTALLRWHPATHGLTDEDLAEFAKQSAAVHFDPGAYIHRAGQHVTALHLVVQGQLKMTVPSDKGEVLADYIGLGDHFGALPLIMGEPLECDVIAVEPSLVIDIERGAAIQLADQFPLFRRNLLRNLGSRLHRTIFEKKAERPPRIVSWIRFGPEGRHVVDCIAKRLVSLDEQLALFTDDVEAQDSDAQTVCSLRDAQGHYLDERESRHQIGQRHQMDRILIDVDGVSAADQIQSVVVLSDVVFWLATRDNCPAALEMLKGLAPNSAAWRHKSRFVVIYPEQQQVATRSSSWETLVRKEFKVPVGGPSAAMSRMQRQGIERIVHHLRGVCLGIALGGGAARGMAHLGVLETLEEAGISFDMIAGTSAGALTGIPYAAGYPANYCVERFAHDLRPSWLFRAFPRGDAWYMLTKYRTGAWDRMLRQYLFDWHLDQLPIPFCTVAVDLVGAQQVIRGEGDAVDALVESINLPGLSRPICRDGMALVDGGLLNVLPADVLVTRGCNFVVAVSVSSKIKHEFAGNRPDTPTHRMKQPSTLQTLMRQITVQEKNMNAVGWSPADFVLDPDVSQYGMAEFVKTPEIANIGREAAAVAIPRLHEMLHQVDPKLFR